MKIFKVLFLTLILIGYNFGISSAQTPDGKRFYTQEKRTKIYVEQLSETKLRILYKRRTSIGGGALRITGGLVGANRIFKKPVSKYISFSKRDGEEKFSAVFQYDRGGAIYFFTLNFLPSGLIEEIRMDENQKILQVFVWTSDKKKKDIAKTKYDALKKKVGQYNITGSTGKFHEANVNKVLFFHKPPKIGRENLTPPDNNFKLGEAIYFAHYLPSPFYAGHDYQINYGYVNALDYSKTMAAYTFSIPKHYKKSYIRYQILPNLAEKNWLRLQGHKETIKSFSKMKPGKYKFWVNHEGTKHEKGFTIDCSKEMIEKCKELVVMLDNKDAKLEAHDLKKKQLPVARMVNPSLEKQMLGFIKEYAVEHNWGQTISKIILTEYDWDIVKNDYGKIFGRMVWVACVSKWNNGKCGYTYFRFYQKYSGAGTYSKVLYKHYSSEITNHYLSCDKVD